MKYSVYILLKISTWLIWIGVIILGFYIGTETAGYDDFNFYAALAIWICGGAWGSLLYSVVLHLENQDTIIENQGRIFQRLNQICDSTNGSSDTVSNAKRTANPPPVHNSGDSWTCPECGKTNPNSQRVCKDCGYNK